MVSFYVFDIALLILFTVGVFIFFKTHKKNMKREGIIFMYRTQLGVKAINWTSNTFRKILHPLKYVIIVAGFLLMGTMIYLLGQTVAIYILVPEITQVIKAPPIAPLIPYFPQLFNIESFFPAFYFTYFIIALAIVAIVHEFSHGIYMKLFKIKIKSTGFVFLGPILGAFVEEEKSQFEKKKKLEQMSVLGAGVFANLVTGFVFFLIYVLFFYASFAPSGYAFNSYALSAIQKGTVTGLEKIDNNLTQVFTSDSGVYYLDGNLAVQLNNSNQDYIIAYSDSPAVKLQMKGAIIQADETKIKNQEDLRIFLETKSPGDNVSFITQLSDGGIKNYQIQLSAHPDNQSKAYLGVGNTVNQPKGIIQKTLLLFMDFKEQSTYYKPVWNADIVNFIFDLIWWIMIINFLVALFNMLPLGILDGGRFFYLAVLSVTRSEKFAKGAFKFMTYLILFIFLFLTLIWFLKVF